MADTLPMDVFTITAPEEPEASFSPEIPTQSKRESYQVKRAVPSEGTIEMGDERGESEEKPEKKPEPRPPKDPAAKSKATKKKKEAKQIEEGDEARNWEGVGRIHHCCHLYPSLYSLDVINNICNVFNFYQRLVFYVGMLGGSSRSLHNEKRPAARKARERPQQRKGARPRKGR